MRRGASHHNVKPIPRMSVSDSWGCCQVSTMPICSICSEEIPEGERTCPLCGTSVDDFVMEVPTTSESAAPVCAPTNLPPGGSYCPVCVRTYGPEYTDGFCSCGTELLKEVPAAPILDEVPLAPVLDAVPMAPVLDDVT